MIHISFLGKSNGIIQILRILSVNGHRLQITKICSAGLLTLLYLIRDILNLLHYLIRILLRQTICFDHRENINTWIIHMSQNLQNTPLRLSLLIAKVRNLHNYLVTGDSPFTLCLCHINILGKFLIVRCDKAKISTACIGSYDNAVAALQNI